MTLMAILTTVELLSFTPQSRRADVLLATLKRTAPAHVRATLRHTYQAGADWLVLWGPGHPARFGPMRQQLAAGGHVLAWDLAYWDRDRKNRVSIDAAHPQAWVMRRDWPTSRWKADGLVLEQAWNPDGPVLVAGIGDKARVQYGAAVDAWEAQMIAAARARGSLVQYRPKRATNNLPRGTTPAPNGPIEQALRGASLVITWHSNVAVDAIRLGIPVICQDGAAAAVCPSDFPAAGAPQPLERDIRDRFLANLAWYQWTPAEAPQLWTWLQAVLA